MRAPGGDPTTHHAPQRRLQTRAMAVVPNRLHEVVARDPALEQRELGIFQFDEYVYVIYIYTYYVIYIYTYIHIQSVIYIYI